MTRALIHVGLVLAVVIAPALCCCKARGLGAVASAAHTHTPSHTPQIPPAVESCHSCCRHAAEQPAATPVEPEPPPVSCSCIAERPDAAQTESKPTVAVAEPTGELLPLPHDVPAGTPEHRGSDRGERRPDAKSAALFERHVMRC